LYGKADSDVFYGTSMSLMHAVTTQGTIFNWENILASSLKTNIDTTKHPQS